MKKRLVIMFVVVLVTVSHFVFAGTVDSIHLKREILPHRKGIFQKAERNTYTAEEDRAGGSGDEEACSCGRYQMTVYTLPDGRIIAYEECSEGLYDCSSCEC